MVTISSASGEKIYRIQKWLGLNECAGGDTLLKVGEASVMTNWRVTNDWKLSSRPGTATVKGLLQAYSLSVAATAAAVRVDYTVCRAITMYPTAAASADGFVALSGTSVAVDYSSAATYAGYYWGYSSLVAYQLVSCTYDAAADTYTWSMKAVTAVSSSTNKTVAGLWSGYVGATQYMVAACDGKLWKVYDGADFCKTEIGSITTTSPVCMFGFAGKLYILNGTQYKEWDGTTYADVVGYRPLVNTEVPPAGGGTLAEGINKLNGLRRCWISPNGTTATFQLPEKNITSIDWVKVNATGATLTPTTDYTVNTTTGVVTFVSTPAAGTDTYEIAWTFPTTYRSTVLAMKFAEMYNGTTDTRVFLYGDGSNKAFYSGVDYDGKPRADYFPDLNVLDVGEANTPITSMIRHYSRLIAYKSDSAYSVQYGTISLAADGYTTIAAFYTTPINRSIGNVAPGQVRLVMNDPVSLFGKDVYEWKNGSSYSSNLTVDERQAVRISDRVINTLDGFNLSACSCYDDNVAQEYYICYNGNALVYNYAANVWYAYSNFPAACMCGLGNDLYMGTTGGQLRLVSSLYANDDGTDIPAYWESGNMAFDRPTMTKYSPMLWVSLQPGAKAELTVTIQTDKKSTFSDKVINAALSVFDDWDFSHFSFDLSTKPRMTRLRLKAKKFVYYKLILETGTDSAKATVLESAVLVRYCGNAK